MHDKGREGAGLVVGGLIVVFCLAGAAPPAPTAPKPPAGAAQRCANYQSPRALNVAFNDGQPRVSKVTRESVVYDNQTLKLCSLHFHCGIENLQGCADQRVSPTPGPDSCPLPGIGSWIEVHRAYSVEPTCVGPVSRCCTQEPVVVLGYHARVATGQGDPGVPLYRLPPYAQWSGSSTGPGGGTCKGPAYWSFTLGCDFKVYANQFTNPTIAGEGTRPLQNYVSDDLTRAVNNN